MKKNIFAIIMIAICLFIVGCSNFDKVLNGNDYDAKFAAAMKYYNDNSFSKAIQLFENLTLHYRGKENAENICWYYAQSLFKEHDYFTAGYQFKRFTRQFPYSEKVEDAAFYSAYCKYLESPSYSLDQTLTKAAIEEFEAFAERWPRSPRMPEVIKYLDEMQDKLIKKDYEIAYNYYFIEEYRAAYESFKQFLNLYPEASQREDAMYYMLRSSYLYALNSREDKQRERYQQVINDFERFSGTFNQSSYMSEAQAIYTKTRSAMAALPE